MSDKKIIKVPKAFNDGVIFEKVEDESTYQGIYTAQLDGENTVIGKVISSGPGKLYANGNFVPNTIKVGDIIAVLTFNAKKLLVGRKDYLACQEVDILAQIEEVEVNE